MTELAMTHEEILDRTHSIMADLSMSVPMMTGALVASADGHPLAADLDESRQRSAAAIVASSFALGQKLSELGGSTKADEMLVRHAEGYVAIYAVGPRAALVVLTRPNVNLGLLNLKASAAVKDLEVLVPALAKDT